MVVSLKIHVSRLVAEAEDRGGAREELEGWTDRERLVVGLEDDH
jgi:hypothetical protein